MKHFRVLELSIILMLLMGTLGFYTTFADTEEEEIDWEYAGRVNTQSDRLKIESSYDPYRIQLHLFLLEDIEDEQTINLVAMYGIRPIMNAPLYSENFEITSAGAIYKFKLLDEKRITWTNITTFDVNNTEYNPDIALFILDIRIKLSKHPEFFESEEGDLFPNINGNFTSTIHLANLTSNIGEVGLWEQVRKDGTIIRGLFHTYGYEEPLYEDEEIGYKWPDYNITVAKDLYRSSLPRTHSVKVAFPFLSFSFAIGTAAILITLFSNIRRRKR